MELKGYLAEVLAGDQIKAIIFTGASDVFLSGANIRELSQLHPDSALEFANLGQHIFQTIADAKPITISAINGYCMGGGLDLALACNIRVASEAAVFSHPGARLGIITGWGGTQRLPRIVGRPKALEFFTTAKRYSSTEALAMGLLSKISDPVFEAAFELAQTTRQKKAPGGKPGAW